MPNAPLTYSLGPVKPHVQSAAYEIGQRFGVKTIYGYGSREIANSDHPLGLALDFMVYTNKSQGDSIAAYCQQNYVRLKVKYIQWQQRIWSVARANEGWRQQANRGSRTANHYDHVHVSFQTSSSAVPTVPAVLPNPLDAIPNPLEPLNDLFKFFTSAQTWTRFALFLAGIVLLLIGLSGLLGETLISRVALRTAKAVAKGVIK
jgi:hypothetical protein